MKIRYWVYDKFRKAIFAYKLPYISVLPVNGYCIPVSLDLSYSPFFVVIGVLLPEFMRIPEYLKKQNDESAHDYIFFVSLISLAFFLPSSRLLLSITQIILFASWIADGKFREKFHRLNQNRSAIFLMLLFPVFVAGMFWTTDPWGRWWISLVDKVPFLTLPLMAATTKQLHDQRLLLILQVFVLSVFITALTGLFLYVDNDFMEFRNLSPFIPHLRFGVMLVMAVFLIWWLACKMTISKWKRIVFYGVSLSLVLFMGFTGWLTAVVSFASVLVFLLLREISAKQHPPYRRLLSGFLLVLSLGAATFVVLTTARPVFYQPPLPIIHKHELTREGNIYTHDLQNLRRENGTPVYWFIAEEELRKAWNERSTLCFDGKNLRGAESLKSTVYRYLASRGLRKDRDGLEALQDYELRAVERGVPNHLHLQWPQLLIRIHQSFWEIQEYIRTGNPAGYSLAQRIELWRAAWVAFAEKPILGWGTGGVHVAVNFGLEEIQSPWELRNIKPHNQYLLYLVSLGLVGFLTVAILFLLFIVQSGAYKHLLFNIMMVILLSAMMGEDLLDFQEPTTFFLFFAVIFGLLVKSNHANKSSSGV